MGSIDHIAVTYNSPKGDRSTPVDFELWAFAKGFSFQDDFSFWTAVIDKTRREPN